MTEIFADFAIARAETLQARRPSCHQQCHACTLKYVTSNTSNKTSVRKNYTFAFVEN